MRPIIVCLAFMLAFAGATTASAQLFRQFNHNFMLADATTVMIQMPDSIVYEPWSGGTFLIESSITLTNANSGILEHVIRNGRYEITLEDNGEQALFKLTNPSRNPIRFREQIVGEKIVYKIYYPQAFVLTATGLQKSQG
jgi:hypothetical protein